MKRNMIKTLVCALLAACMLCSVSAWAEDSEEALRRLLADKTGSGSILEFYHGDYDGDGTCEAFAMVGEMDEFTGGMNADLWFVSPRSCKTLQTGLSYLNAGAQGSSAPMLFTAEEWYGGSGSTSHMWVVQNSAPVAIEANIYEGFEAGQGNEFYSYPSAFDQFTDGTGHTWKRYYFFLDGLTMREYGGIRISIDELLEFEGAQEILSKATAGDDRITDIFYRGNGVINVNLSDGSSNSNLTLRYDDVRVTDTGEDYGGVYDAASNPSIAVYPEAFVHPSGNAAGNAGADEPTGALDEAKQNIIRRIGMFSFDELSFVSGVQKQVIGDEQNFEIFLMDGVYSGGSDGFYKEYLTTQGAMAELDADLDGDGVDEYLILSLKTEDFVEWIQHTVELRIHELKADGSGYVLVETLDLGSFGGDIDDNFVRLTSTDAGMFIVNGSSFVSDGACKVVSGTVYSYDGEQVHVETSVYLNSYVDSIIMTRRRPLQNGVPALITDIYEAEEHGFEPGRDYISFDGTGSPEINAGALNAAAAYLGAYGIELAYDEPVGVSGGKLLLRSGMGYSNSCTTIELFFRSGLEFSVPDKIYDENDNAARMDTPDPALPDVIVRTNPDTASGLLVQATNDVNVRSGPGTDYAKLGVMYYAETLEYYGEEQYDSRGVAWYKMNFRGQVGWVSSKYTNIIEEDNNYITSVPAEAEEITYVRIEGGSANIRSGPGLGYSSIGSLKKGREVEYLGQTIMDERGVGWHYINFNGKTGWVSSKYGKLR